MPALGKWTDYDKLQLKSGLMVRQAEDAVAYAAKIMKEQLTIFINFDEESEPLILEDSQEEKIKSTKTCIVR